MTFSGDGRQPHLCWPTVIPGRRSGSGDESMRRASTPFRTRQQGLSGHLQNARVDWDPVCRELGEHPHDARQHRGPASAPARTAAAVQYVLPSTASSDPKPGQYSLRPSRGTVWGCGAARNSSAAGSRARIQPRELRFGAHSASSRTRQMDVRRHRRSARRFASTRWCIWRHPSEPRLDRCRGIPPRAPHRQSGVCEHGWRSQLRCQELTSATHLTQIPPHPHARLDATGISELFEESGLAAPPIPASLEPTFAGRDQWAFASRPITPGFGHMAAYHAWPYLPEMLTGEPVDYVAVSAKSRGAGCTWRPIAPTPR